MSLLEDIHFPKNSCSKMLISVLLIIAANRKQLMCPPAGEMSDSLWHICTLFSLRFYLFLDRGREREREGAKHQCVVAFMCPLLGTWPATQACALTRESNW